MRNVDVYVTGGNSRFLPKRRYQNSESKELSDRGNDTILNVCSKTK